MERKRASRSEVERKEVGEEGTREQEREKREGESLLAERNPNKDMETQVGMNV